MKRRVEEPKQESSNSLATPAYLGTASRHQGAGGNPLSPHPAAARILTTPHSGTGVLQQTFSVSKADSSSGSSMPGSVQHFSLSSAQQPTSFGGGAPTPTAPTAPAKGPSSGLQGGAPSVTTLQTQAHQQHSLHQTQAHQQLRHKVHTNVVAGGAAGANSSMPSVVPSSGATTGAQQQTQQQQFQRLKVEDALSYLDMVKFKFGNQPQVYNDFLDIMKEFKSQSIDTPGVIQRVSNLFKGHPELIVGFNTFLPPGYKIEVQASEQGFALQVSVSMPSPTAPSTTMVHTPVSHHTMVLPSLSTPGLGSSPPPQVTLTSVSTSSVVTQPQAIKSPVLQIVHSTSGSSSTHHTLSSLPTPNSHHPHHQSPVPTTAVAVVTTVPQQQPPSLYQPAPTPAPPTPPISAAPAVSAGGGHHHHNNAHHPHHAATSVFAHQAVSQALSHVESGGGGGPNATPQSQPVEFNHAINYVNKIKNRFQGQPDKYKRFLEILHTYQKEQRNLKDGCSTPGKHLTEAEVYSQVAKLFENQDDLLAEFGQFLPDATSHQAALSSFVSQGTKSGSGGSDHSGLTKKPGSGMKPSSGSSGGYNSICPGGNLASSGGGTERPAGTGSKFGSSAGQVKRSPSSYSASGASGPPPTKKHKMASLRDVSLAEACKYGSLNDYAFFDKARKALKNQDVYENFLRCLILFNQEVVSRSELVQLVTPFLGKFPELFRWFREFIGHGENNANNHGTQGPHGSLVGGPLGLEPLPNSVARQDRPVGDLAMEIDYTTCKRLGASYCALPKTYVQPKSSGRTPLCKEVLNDSWVSFPTWSSEDSTFVTSRKTQYEEYIYRCEDERFELDVVIETNAATIRVLEGVHKKLSRLSPEEVAKFRLDECLGGTSPTIHQRALRRIYGDKAQDIIDGLKKNPVVAVPVVLRRLKAKEEEWREAQKGFNKLWREQNEKYYLKSLDHQGMNFKQNDVKALRSKSLFNEIETIYDERHEQAEEGSGEVAAGPHLLLPYKDKTVLDDAANLLIHHVKRQTGIHKEDKQRIKQLLRQLVPDMFSHPRQELSDDEREDEDEKEDGEAEGCNGCPVANPGKAGRRGEAQVKKEQDAGGGGETINDPHNHKLPPHAISTHPDESYTLLFGNNHCYLFLRLHQILCERLTKMYERAVTLAAEEARHQQLRNESAAVALRLKPKSEIEVRDYYPAFLDMVKNVLDGNMDGSAYEDTLREMFGIHAYVAFTLDKVVTYAVRQLQNLVCDESCQECLDLLQQELRRGGAGGPCSTAHQRLALEQAYQRRAEQALSDENCFKIYVYKVDCKLTMELLDTEPEDPEPVAEVEKWSSYVESFANSGVDGLGAGNGGPTASEGRTDVSGDDNDDLELMLDNLRHRKPVYLDRNVRLFRRRVSDSPGTPLDCKELLSHLHPPNNKRPSTPPHHDEEGREDSKDKSSSEDEKAVLPLPHVNNNAPESMVGGDMTECRFNINSYRMVFVVNKENFLYKRQSLPKAKEAHSAISTRLSSKFRAWHLHWASDHVTDLQHRTCADWLMGRGEGVVPNRTRMLTDNDQGRPPYRSYNRYRVERLQPVSSGEISS